MQPLTTSLAVLGSSSCLAIVFLASTALGQDTVIAEPPVIEPSDEAAELSGGALPEETTEPADEPTDDLAPLEDQARLGAWFAHLSRNARSARLTSGASNLVGSGLVMGLGIWAYLQDPPENELAKGAGLVALGGSGVFMSLAIFQLATQSPPEKTLERWTAARHAGLTPKELSRFEGELRQYSESVERIVRLGRWSNFGMAMTGALILGLTPAADLSRDGRSIGYTTGGVAAGVGLLGFALSFIGQSDSNYWNAYLKGQPPPKSSKWSASPELGRTFAGARITGRF